MGKADVWKPTTERFVAFFDIMGFKDLVLKNEHEDIVTLLNTLTESRKKLNEANNVTSKPNNAEFGETKSFTFSDSIIFFTKSSLLEDLHKIILDCLLIMRISFQNQIPIKGSFSFGKITIDVENSIYFGQPIIDAYLLHEDLHLFAVIADNAFEKKAKELNVDLLKKRFEFYKSPLKSGKAFHYILKPLPIDKKDALIYLNKLYETVSGKPRQYIDNTIEFITNAKSED